MKTISLSATKPVQTWRERIAEYVKTIPKGQAVIAAELAKEWKCHAHTITENAPAGSVVSRKLPQYRNAVNLLVCPNQ